jgi:hypothetical protein
VAIQWRFSFSKTVAAVEFTHELVRKEQDSLEGEFAVAEIEKVL